MLAGRAQQAAAGWSFNPVGVVFDGANDYLTAASLTGQADSAQVTFSAWIKPDSSNVGIYAQDTAARFEIYWDSGFGLVISETNGASTRLFSSALVLSTGVWQHLLISIDMSNASKRHVYIDDASVSMSWNTYNTSAVLNFTPASGNHVVGDFNNYNFPFDGAMADFWMAPGEYLDLSVEANRRKFITAGGVPAFLGNKGELPTGAPPLIYLGGRYGKASNWNVNRSRNGDFSLTGSLGTDATPPGVLL